MLGFFFPFLLFVLRQFCFISQAGLEINDPPVSVSRAWEWVCVIAPSKDGVLKRHMNNRTETEGNRESGIGGRVFLPRAPPHSLRAMLRRSN